MDNVRQDLRRMGITNWRIRVHRRDDWKMVVKEAKVLHGLVEPWSSSKWGVDVGMDPHVSPLLCKERNLAST